jgi:predicted phosphodiesterase
MGAVTAVVFVSDVHYGKRTRTYDRRVAEQRLTRTYGQLDEIRTRHPETSGIVIAMLGDMVDGAEVYPAQAMYQDVPDAQRQAVELARIVAPWVEAVAARWGEAAIYAVYGNHGRMHRAHEEQNWDHVFYRFLQQMLAGKIPVRLNERGDGALFPVRVQGRTILLHHGDAIRAWGGIPWYGLERRLGRWALAGYAPDVLALGHFHTLGLLRVGKTTVLMNGTPVTDDDWAYRQYGYVNANSWWVVGIGKGGIAWLELLDLS